MLLIISENYIFGKFDTFCKRLEKISDMSNIMESLLELQCIQIEGIEEINTRFQTIATNTKSKEYDVLDHRKKEVHELSACLMINPLILCYSLKLCREDHIL